jgi:hypothetical protein
MPVTIVHSTVIDPTATTSAVPTPTPTTLPTTESERPASKLLPRMVSNDRQSMAPFRRTRRLQNPFSLSTSTTALTPAYSYNRDQRQLLRQEIADLLFKRAIEPVPASVSPGFYTRMFVIPKKNGGYRPVFNLKALNAYVHCPHFQMESIQQVIKLINKGDFFTLVDLIDAFLHILIHRQFRKYLHFQWDGHIFQFRTTPFGLSVVPWLFTRLTKPVLLWTAVKI